MQNLLEKTKNLELPTLQDITENHHRLRGYVVETPTLRWDSASIRTALGNFSEIYTKCELFQTSGSFKYRGALTVLHNTPAEATEKGIITCSGGNHGIATALSAKTRGIHAKIVVPKKANAFRIESMRDAGAEVVIVEDVFECFATADRIAKQEGRFYLHPYEGYGTSLGAAGIGLEIAEQSPHLEAVVVSVGGGGLISGISSALKLNPKTEHIEVIGVEPEGASSMSLSLENGQASKLDKVDTIADSLSAIEALPYSFSLCQKFVDEVLLVKDDDIREAMKLAFSELKLGLEPACAATVAALFKHRDRFQGKRVGLVLCGSNIDFATFQTLVTK